MPSRIRRTALEDALPIEYRHNKTFSIPSSSRATPDEWASMASYATGLVVARYSIATAVGRDPASESASLSEAADRLLTSREAAMFDSWRSDPSSALPRADWRRLRASISGSPASRRRWAAFVPALSLLYELRSSDSLSPENCKAWAEKYPNVMPLLVAARKMDRAKFYAKCVGSSNSARLDFFELIACRKLMSEIGAQRIKASLKMKEINKYAAEKEQDLLRRLSKLNITDAPSSRDSAAKASEARDVTYSKLTKTRTSRISDAAMVKRQNVELTALETALRTRIAAIETRLEDSRRSGPSSSRGKSRR